MPGITAYGACGISKVPVVCLCRELPGLIWNMFLMERLNLAGEMCFLNRAVLL